MSEDLCLSGDALRRRGDYAQAERLLREAVALAEAADPPNRRTLAIALNGLGLVLKDLGEHDQARQAYRRALPLFESTAENSDDWIATVYHNLGGIEHASGNYRDAEPLARRGLAIRRAASADAELIAKDMVALAAILDSLAQPDEAELLYREALHTFEQAPTANAGEIAVTLHGLGTLEGLRGRLGDAESYLSRAIAIKIDLLGSRHADVAVTLNNLAFVYKQRGELERAATTYLAAMEILAEALGTAHPKTVACRVNYSHCVADSGRGAAGNSDRLSGRGSSAGNPQNI